MNEIENIVESNKNKFIYLYPKVSCKDGAFITDNINKKNITDVLVNDYKATVEKTQSHESYFKDICQINSQFIKKTIEQCKSISYNKYNMIVTIFKIDNIDKSSFPKLVKYDYDRTINTEIYTIDNIKLLIVNDGNKEIICVDISNLQKSNVYILNNLLSLCEFV